MTTAVAQLSATFGLSGRQEAILGLVARGLSNKEIGGLLEIDYRTVAEHVARTCEKIGAPNRAQLSTVVIGELARVIDRRGDLEACASALASPDKPATRRQ